VRDVHFLGPMTRYQSGKAEGVATNGGYRVGERSDLAIPPTGAPESLRRSGPEARRDRAATRAQRAILTASTQGFRMRAPEGWPRLQHRARSMTLRRVGRVVGCGG
jgi:hypothetical protein